MRRCLAGLVAILSLVISSCDSESAPAAAVGTLERDRIELIAEARETIVRLHVAEGDQVERGELLVELDDRRTGARLESAQGARDRAAALLAELTRGPRREEIAEARARLAEAEAAILEARPERQRTRALVDAEVESASRMDRADATYGAAVARRDALRATLDRLLNGTTREELAQAQAGLAEAEAALAAARVDSERLRVTAPRSGRVDALPFEVGEQPPPGGVVAVLLADGQPYARVYVPADQRPYVNPGTAASVRVEGVERAFAGRVRTVSSEAAFTPFFALTEQDRGRLAYLAEVDLVEEEAKTLPTGLPVAVTFDLAAAGADGRCARRRSRPVS